MVAALSSRGLGRGPLKAQTRVRIPLALLMDEGCSTGIDRPHRLSVRTAPFHGAERGSIPLGAIAADRLTIDPVSRQVSDEEGVFDPDSSSWGRSSAWLEHSTVTREVAGSSPVGPVLFLERSVCDAVSLLHEHSRGLALVVKLVDTPS